MKGFDFDVVAFAYDLCVLTFAVWAAGTALLWTLRYFIETVVPEYDPTGKKKRWNEFIANQMHEEKKQ